jgi:NADH-ubiquinone oxidoreductase chain 2
MLTTNLILLILSNAVTGRRDKSILYNRIASIILLYSILSSITSLTFKSLEKGVGIYNGLFFTTSITTTFQIFIYLLCIVILQLTSFYPRKLLFKDFNMFLKKNINSSINTFKIGEQFKIIEYPLILLFIIIGANFLISSSDLISVFISIELQSYGLYLLCCLYRNSESATSAGLMYFLLGGLSSCFILLGICLIYINIGTTNLDNFYVINNLQDLTNQNSFNIISYLDISLIIMVVGFLFKISAAPFHFWSPDVYDGIPTIVTTFVTIIAKISILIFLLELTHYTNNTFNILNWTTILLLSSLLSLLIGTILGLNEPRIKRLLAYSTISHLGFILLALSINSLESIQAFTFYLIQYSISNLNAFLLLIAIGYSLYIYVLKTKDKESTESSDNYDDAIKNYNTAEKNNSPVQLITQLKGYFYLNPMIAMSLCITIYSFVGIPPLVGFFAKQMVLSAALDNGYIFLSYVAILVSVISAVYYLNIIRQMFFESSNLEIDNNLLKNVNKESINNVSHNNIIINSSLTITISIITLIILLFFSCPNEWLSMTNILSLILFNT